MSWSGEGLHHAAGDGDEVGRPSGVPWGMRNGREVATKVGRIWLDDGGIVHFDSFAGAEHTVLNAEEVLAAMRGVVGPQPRPVLVTLSGIKSMDRDARAVYRGPATVGIVRAAALLIGSPLTRVIASFFMGLSKPAMPTQAFTSKAEALAWLRTFLS